MFNRWIPFNSAVSLIFLATIIFINIKTYYLSHKIVKDNRFPCYKAVVLILLLS
jgi:hypothetical protein